MPRRPDRKKRRGQRDLSLPYVEQVFEVGEPEHGQRLDAFLAARVSWHSREGVRKFIEEGWVEVLPGKDPQRAPVAAMKRGLKLRWGQEVVLRTPAPQAAEGAPRPVVEFDGLEVIYEDDSVVAVNKPPGISVHPSKGHLTGSLIHLVHERHRAMHGDTDDVPTLCHRLDRETSGVVLAAKDQLARTRIGRQFEARTVQKTYLALVVGEMAEEAGVIDLPIGRALTASVRLKMNVRHDPGGLPSQTEWRVAKRIPGHTLVELRPRTGRQHQLRVHLAAIGHPILGDKLYQGGEEVFIRAVQGELTAADRELLVLERQALHAWKLEVEHPMTGRPLILDAQLWADVAALVAG
ncbi:MAG: RluA family pseudouridine synthase [Planctomycetes bacterium]|nr:RluA family pseudouridine synthase [Planctomycetota bacterium]